MVLVNPEGAVFKMLYVLTLPLVTGAIGRLEQSKIHETFIAFLHIRHRAEKQGKYRGITPEWTGQVREWLEMPGGPPHKPHYRPFGSRGAGRKNFWMNENLAGSYAPSSLRQMKEVFIDSEGTYRVPTVEGKTDVEKIMKVFLYGKPVPAWAVAGFLYRNRGFDAEGLPASEALLDTFIQDFQWSLDEQNLFTWEKPEIDPVFEVISNE